VLFGWWIARDDVNQDVQLPASVHSECHRMLQNVHSSSTLQFDDCNSLSDEEDAL
jgi:hypothetical protein